MLSMKAVDTRNTLAQRIRKARKETRLSQRALGVGIGVSDKTISSYEQSRSVPPFARLRKIAAYTNRPITYFTEERSEKALITTKLSSIERELAEVKRLLKRAKK